MNPKYDEHLRDSAPDNSRFDGFDRGDLDNPDAYPVAEAAPRKHFFSNTAMNLLAALGIGAGFGLPSGLSPKALYRFSGQRTNPERNAQRKRCRGIGHRQHRRETRAAYLLRDGATIC